VLEAQERPKLLAHANVVERRLDVQRGCPIARQSYLLHHLRTFHVEVLEYLLLIQPSAVHYLAPLVSLLGNHENRVQEFGISVRDGENYPLVHLLL
jgi:hypothetical protein